MSTHTISVAAAALGLLAGLPAQPANANGRISAPFSAAAGETITIEVCSIDPSVLVLFGDGTSIRTEAAPNGKATLELPLGSGPKVTIYHGRGARRTSISIEVLAPPP